MGKYNALAEFLASLPADEHDVEVTLASIARLVGGLPPTAYSNRTWWANSSHVQALAWAHVGWHVERVHFDRGSVVFARGPRGGSYAARGYVAEGAQRVPERSSTSDLPADTDVRDVRTEWHWEGNVQAAVVAALVRAGWTIRRVADTALRERGVDIEAVLDGRSALIEVKGFPSKVYATGDRAGEPKPTSPSLQAKHWLADAVFATLRLRSAQAAAVVAIAVPEHPRYRSLVADVASALDRLAIAVLVVRQDGAVEGIEALTSGTAPGLA